ncbi:MAG: MlaD family protein, partial [Alphaproteobacteria bacterium]|nr:MlaD family protein [Alphaproteobacteria bacterium]
MKKEPNKSLIGIFLIAGILVFSFIVGRIVWQKYAEGKHNVFVMYFEESLQGLNEGTPIVFQGVEIGKVSGIKIIANEDNLKFRVAVYSHLKPTGILSYKSGQEAFLNKRNAQNLIRVLIQRGLRARLV